MLANADREEMKNLRFRLALAYSFLYVLVTTLYVYFSDVLVTAIARNPQELEFLQTAKGIAFMFASGLALFSLLYISMGRLLRAKHIIRI